MEVNPWETSGKCLFGDAPHILVASPTPDRDGGPEIRIRASLNIDVDQDAFDTLLIPMLPANAEFMNSSRITFAAYGNAIDSRSAFSALAITSRQKRSIAPRVCPLRRSHESSDSREYAGTGRINAANARARAILSAIENACADSNFGIPCKGAGSSIPASFDGPNCDRRPPGSIIVISLVQ